MSSIVHLGCHHSCLSLWAQSLFLYIDLLYPDNLSFEQVYITNVMKASSGTHKARVVVKWMPLHVSFKWLFILIEFIFNGQVAIHLFYSLCCEPQC